MNRKKKILATVTACIALAIIATIVTLALIPSNFYNPIPKNATYIEIWKNGSSENQYYSRTELTEQSDEYYEVYEKVYELHQKSLQEGILTSFFQGAYKFEESVKYSHQDLNNLLGASENTFVLFDFGTTQSLKFNGKTYEDKDSTEEDKTVYFTKMILEVKDSENFADVTVYLENTNVSSSQAMNSYYRVRIIAHQAELYSYLQEI